MLYFRCNADHFAFDERDDSLMDMKQFYVRYRDKLPMLAVFVGGWDGDTHYDCYENYQVLLPHCVN